MRGKAAYFKIFELAYQHGYDPNVRIVPERFRKAFASLDEAVDFVCALKPDLAEGDRERIARNVAPFCTEADGGVEFCIATAAALIWWDVCGGARFSPDLLS